MDENKPQNQSEPNGQTNTPVTPNPGVNQAAPVASTQPPDIESQPTQASTQPQPAAQPAPQPTTPAPAQPANSVPQPTPNTQPQNNIDPVQPKSKKSPLKILIAIVGIIVPIAILGFVYITFLRPESIPESLKPFNDPNLTMLIDESWIGDSSYEPGERLIAFFSPENADDENRDKTYRLTIFVNSDDDRLDNQLSNLDESGVDYTLIEDSEYEKNGTKYKYLEVVAAEESRPDNKIHVASITARRGDFVINADIVGLEKYWDLHKDIVSPMLKSIVPACDNPKLDEPVTSSAFNYCE